MFLSNIRVNRTKTNSYSNNLISPLILVAISFNITLINFTSISLRVKVDYICILYKRYRIMRVSQSISVSLYTKCQKEGKYYRLLKHLHSARTTSLSSANNIVIHRSGTFLGRTVEALDVCDTLALQQNRNTINFDNK